MLKPKKKMGYLAAVSKKKIVLALGKEKRNKRGKVEYSVNESEGEGWSDVSPVFTAERELCLLRGGCRGTVRITGAFWT